MDLAIFKYQDKEVRTLELDKLPYFAGRDVALVLGYSDTDQAIRNHVDEEDKVTRELDGIKNLIFINESGLYSLILRSRLDSAKDFKRWVTSEVLPSIRKDGGYISPNSSYTQLDKLQETITTLLVNQQKQLDVLAIEQKKLFKSGETNPGCYSVVVAGMDNEYEDAGYVTVDEWLRAKGITLDTTQLNTIRKRAASFYRIGKSLEPTKIGNRVVYSPSQYCYLEQALVSTLGLTV